VGRWREGGQPILASAAPDPALCWPGALGNQKKPHSENLLAPQQHTQTREIREKQSRDKNKGGRHPATSARPRLVAHARALISSPFAVFSSTALCCNPHLPIGPPVAAPLLQAIARLVLRHLAGGWEHFAVQQVKQALATDVKIFSPAANNYPTIPLSRLPVPSPPNDTNARCRHVTQPVADASRGPFRRLRLNLAGFVDLSPGTYRHVHVRCRGRWLRRPRLPACIYISTLLFIDPAHATIPAMCLSLDSTDTPAPGPPAA
jgi:hypothetical protein